MEESNSLYSLVVVTKMSAFGVLGQFDHHLELDKSETFGIIYGPNGVGKTRFLEIIDAMSSLDSWKLLGLPFEHASLEFSDSSVLKVIRSGEPQPEATEADVAGPQVLPDLQYIYIDSSGVPHEWVPADLELTPMMLSRFERYGWERISAHTWRDSSDGEIVDTRTLLDRLSPRIGLDYPRGRRPHPVTPEETATREFMAHARTFLIETQRLRMEVARPEGPGSGMVRKSREMPRIRQLAEGLVERLTQAQTEHSRITQKLDRTFPYRVMQAARQSGTHDAGAENKIIEEYKDQGKFRSRLGSVAAVELEEELPLPEEGLGAWDLALLALYVDDTRQKLVPFNDVIAKIDLLEDIINRRLLGKRLTVTSATGLEIFRDSDHGKIELESLSSGEQHEIILITELLFDVGPGSLVLIDEPEISLHVAWQLAFIPDVMRIAKAAGFRFIVATHSPQIINEDWDKATRLGPEGVPL
ncbi:MAG: AAA family ATPase [Micrococcaceae bacterium]|nr:AAA family ATPase [Micrococcaceae bacterium]